MTKRLINAPAKHAATFYQAFLRKLTFRSCYNFGSVFQTLILLIFWK